MRSLFWAHEMNVKQEMFEIYISAEGQKNDRLYFYIVEIKYERLMIRP